MTALSPLRFQKQLRLQETRRLLLAESFDAAVPASESAMKDRHFSEEYKRLFCEPPVRDVERPREAATVTARR